MNLFTREQTHALNEQRFAFIEVAVADHVMTLTLDRPEKKNALHPQMVHEIAFAFQYAHYEKDIRVVVILAKGDVFCAGADLKAFAGISEPFDSSIPGPSGEVLIGELFNQVHKPVIAKVTGDVYAGGFFFLAGSHVVVAQEGLTFGLPEVKRGLYPFQVMAALLRVMPPRKVIDWCIRGYHLPVAEAMHYGLVSQVVDAGAIDAAVAGIVAELKENSPTAIRMGLAAYEHIRPAGAEHQYLMEMLQQTILSQDGQEGLRAFREKRKPVWTGE
jgi:enoyl-CoA hydratase/carnithine racemase